MLRRRLFGILSTAVVPPARASGADRASKAVKSGRQLLRVESAGWTATTGVLTLWARDTNDGKWRQAGAEIPVLLGRNGLRWGRGLHVVPDGVPVKCEGDGCSPAGVFQLDTAFGSMPVGQSGAVRWPWQTMTASHAGVDDPRSRHYNRVVDAAVVKKDWSSAEDMVPKSGVYRRGIVVRHNWSQQPGAGSCIFLHLRFGAGKPTAGCTAMAEPELVRILGWLDPGMHPLLVQLPRSEWLVKGPEWGLPASPNSIKAR